MNAELLAKRRAQTERAARILAERAETIRIVTAGICPLCGSKIRRNNALTGWYTCEQVGAPGFRADNAKAQCTWQGFTE
jgi:hypothetical protein